MKILFSSRQIWLLTLQILLISICIGPYLVEGLFEDQAFKFDWRLQYVGKPVKSLLWHDSSSARSDLILTITQSNVFAGIHADSGKIKWRHQVLSEGKRIYDLSMTSSGKTTTISSTSNGEMQVHTWNPSNGVLYDEVTLASLINVEAVQSAFINEDNVYVVESKENGFKIQSYDIKTGKEAESKIILDDMKECVSTNSLLACLSADKKSVHYSSLPLEGSTMEQLKLNSIPDSSDIDTISAVDHTNSVVLKYRGKSTSNILLLSLVDGKLSEGKSYESSLKQKKNIYLSGCATKKRSAGALLEIEQTSSSHDSPKINVKINDNEKEITLGTDRGYIEASLAACSKNEVVGQVYITFSDGSLVAVSLAKETVKWSREEGLSNLVAVELIDAANKLNEDIIDPDIPQVGEKQELVDQFLRRIRRHANQIYSVLRHLSTVKDITSYFIDQSASNSDQFGIRKVIVAVTAYDKVYGLDSKTGNVLWQLMIPGGLDLNTEDNSINLFVQRKANYHGMDGKCLLLYTNLETEHVELISFNPINGKLEPRESRSFGGSSIVKAFLLHHSNEDNIRPLVVLNKNNQVMIEPENEIGAIKALSGKIFIASVSKDKDKITGQRLIVTNDDEIKLTTIWTLTSPGATVMHLVSKPTDQTVHSQGRVMADRSVLFKYINPNLAFVLAEGKDASSKSFINIYLIDLITGRIVFSVTHKKVNGPYHIVHSENWAVYTYYNEKSRRAELSSLELFEGKTQSNATAFSSLTNNVSPLVERQSYILDPSFVTSLADTKTEKAITTKHILMATSTGAIYDIPKHFLDPRRPNMNTPADQREPGLPAYLPELKLPPESILNYNQSVTGAKGIVTAPTGLESTSVVFVHGLDLYCTSVTPSKGFDLLKDDFDYYVITSVLMGLVIASYATRKLSQNKALKQAWR